MYLGIATGENRWLKNAAASCQNLGHTLEVIQTTSEILDEEEKKFIGIVDELKSCDLVLMKNHGTITYFKKFDRIHAIIKSLKIPTFIHSNVPEEMVDNRDLFPFSDEQYHNFLTYFSVSGKENTESLLLLALKVIKGIEVEIPPVQYAPTEGFYHPSLPDTLEFADHVKRLDPKKPTIGILAHRFFSNPDIHPIGLLIKSFHFPCR